MSYETDFLEMIDLSYRFQVDPGEHSISAEQIDPLSLSFRLDSHQLNQIKEGWSTDKLPLSEPLSLKPNFDLQCRFCGSKQFVTDGLSIKSVEPCSAPAGLSVSVSIDVPSGRLAVGNDFRDVFPEKLADPENLFTGSTEQGIAATIQDISEKNAAYFFVGNSCPALYKVEDDRFEVRSSGQRIGNEQLPDKVKVAEVITDLWWVSIADAQQYQQMGGVEQFTEVSVTPGRYQLDYFGLHRGFDFDDRTLYFADFYLAG